MDLPSSEFQNIVDSGLFPNKNQLAGKCVFMQIPTDNILIPWSRFLQMCGVDVIFNPDLADFNLSKRNVADLLMLLGVGCVGVESADLKLNASGLPEVLTFGLNGCRHNSVGPSGLWWHDNGHIHHKEFCINGDRHRNNGPAFQSWDESGRAIWAEFWVKGEKVTKGSIKNTITLQESIAKITVSAGAVHI